MASQSGSRSRPTSLSREHRSDWTIHGAGVVTALAYTWLSVASWGHTEVPLSLFGVLFGTAWAALAALLLLHRPFPKEKLRLLVGWALLFRVIGLVGEPLLEDDHYRYLWDGRVFAIESSPYGSPPLRYFGDPEIPERFQEILSEINHPDLPTIYGPVCQYAFLLSYWMAPGEVFPLKAILILSDLATLWLLAGLTSPVGLLLYAWNPLLIKETAFTAHPDSLAVFFMVAALALRRRGRVSAASVLAALAVGTRLHALILVPFLLVGMARSRRAWLLFAGTLGALYLPFLLGGDGEIGLGEFARYWEFNSFGYGLLVATVPPWIARPTAGILFLFGYGWLFLRWRRSGSTSIPGEWVYGLLFFLSPVVNPWYLLWLLPFVAIRPSIWGIAAMAAVGLSYVHGLYLPGWDLAPYHHPIWLRPLEWGSVILAGIWEWRRRRVSAKTTFCWRVDEQIHPSAYFGR